MTRLIRSKDWSKTPLGPIEDWPQSLKTTVSLCLASNFPINIIWGADHIQIYNDGYRVVCGDAHPVALGQDYSVTWESAWPAIGDPFERALSGQTSFLENQRMFLTRNGYLEETFFTFSHSPIRDETGGIGGLFHPVTETTATMLAERRTRALRDLTSSLGAATDLDEFARLTVKTLTPFEFDLPFFVLYLLDDDSGKYVLAGQHGLPPVSPAAPSEVDPSAASIWPIQEAIASARIVETDCSGIFSGARVGPYDEPPNSAFVLPVVAPGAERTPAIVVVGASPRLPLNDVYRGFYELLTASISAALTSVRAREDERRRAEALAEIDRAKTAFFSNVSHEFRTPLTLMLGPIEDALADAGDLAEPQRDRLNVAHRNAMRLLKLVNALLDFSRIEAGRMQAHFEPTDIASLTADLASNFRSACERAGLDLVVDCPNTKRLATIDRDMWEKIVLNLISNAFKFTLKGRITVSLRDIGDDFELVVSDTGVGVPAAQLPLIFNRFHRIEGQKGRTHEGTGIGLSLVKELVTLHGGAITAESIEGLGTSLRVRIPGTAAKVSPPTGQPTRELTPNPVRASAFVEESLRWLPDAGADETAAPPERSIEGRPRVLLADDNADMRAYVRRILESGGYEVETVGNGVAALKAISHAIEEGVAPDLVLSDVMMPEMDGFKLLGSLRDDPRLDSLVVILLSARAGEEARVEGLAAGADDYLVKPFSARELRARVDGAVTLARQRRQAADRERDLYAALATEKANVALLFTEQQLDVALTAGRMGTWSSDLATGMLTMSAVCREVFGLPPEGPILAADVIATIHPKDIAQRNKAVEEALASGKDIDLEYRIRRPDGELAWVLARGRVERGQDGKPTRIVGVAFDTTDRKTSEGRQRVMVAELNHRVKNTLATVQWLAFQTRRTADNPHEFNLGLDSRIRALATAHDLLTANSWVGAMLKDVIGKTLAPHATSKTGNSRITMGGPAVRLDPNAAVTLNMAFHELATNAVKYGALSEREGRISVEWFIDSGDSPRSSDHALKIIWTERNGPLVSPPTRRGFGSGLLEKGLAHDLAAEVTLTFAPEGLVCTMKFPLSQRIQIPA